MKKSESQYAFLMSFLAFLTKETLENFNDFWQFFGSWFIYSISEWNSLFQITV